MTKCVNEKRCGSFKLKIILHIWINVSCDISDGISIADTRSKSTQQVEEYKDGHRVEFTDDTKECVDQYGKLMKG